jgi:hypothetical protein
MVSAAKQISAARAKAKLELRQTTERAALNQVMQDEAAIRANTVRLRAMRLARAERPEDA